MILVESSTSHRHVRNKKIWSKDISKEICLGFCNVLADFRKKHPPLSSPTRWIIITAKCILLNRQISYFYMDFQIFCLLLIFFLNKISVSILKPLHKFLAWHISSVARCNLTFPLKSLTFLSIIVLRTFCSTTVICVVYSDLKKLIWQKNGINSWTFPCYNFLQYSTWIITTRVHWWILIFVWW